VARDAIARQYDVEKNLTQLVCLADKGEYRPGTITFYAKKGKSIDIDRIRDSIKATRLSGGTSMSVTFLEVTATGEVAAREEKPLFKVKGTTQQFVLEEDPKNTPKDGTKTALQRLREALDRGEKVTSVTGRVQGWTGVFPGVLRALEKETATYTAKTKQPAISHPWRLVVTDFQTAKE
jgi:hypothetical protein